MENKNFFISTAKIVEGEKPSLCFTVAKNDAAFPAGHKFGAIMLPTDNTWGRDMFIDTPIIAEWGWTEEDKDTFFVKSDNGYTPETLSAENIISENGMTLYDIVIKDIEEKDFWTSYSVKGFVRYTENGEVKTVYTDYMQTSLYRLSKGVDSPLCRKICDYVENGRKEKYMAENFSEIQKISGFSDTEDKDPNHNMYIIKNGYKLRDVSIDSGRRDKNGNPLMPVEILHFADVHLNYVNERDIKEADINTISTYRGRAWNRNGYSIPRINTAMELASFYDKAVITGDIMDYFSWGCGEIMTKLIVDKSDGNVIMAIGNHEPAELMQNDIPDLKYRYSEAERYERIQSVWPNNVYYHSEIVKNKNGDDMALVVALDNQRHAYWGHQAEPLQKDADRARALGIPMLIFQHCMICTNNPEYARATFFGEPGDVGGKDPATWYTDTQARFAGCAGSDEETMSVYNVIVRNHDVIKGIFCGDWHNNMYTEILGQNPDGTQAFDKNGKPVVIPQHTVTVNAYMGGNAIKITVS